MAVRLQGVRVGPVCFSVIYWLFESFFFKDKRGRLEPCVLGMVKYSDTKTLRTATDPLPWLVP